MRDPKKQEKTPRPAPYRASYLLVIGNVALLGNVKTVKELRENMLVIVVLDV